MNGTVIQVDDISKLYRLGQVGTGTLSHDINRIWHRIRGKEDPYSVIGEANDRSRKGSSDYVWALRNVSFTVKEGEVVGIVGKNGAGKSTLLKLLSRTTSPTTGSIKVKGRIASLLEVGTGFHPELSGRDNIFLNGAILGMTKKEITRKFDEIVDFAGVERYIDTPVKRYSSGMYVRLAFAVAAHLEPEILIVDEVLAVGDAEFQNKCLGKMKDVSRAGRTILFVSHNMGAVKTLCNKSILMEAGKLSLYDKTDNVISKYLESQSSLSSESYFENQTIGDEQIFITSFGLASSDGVYKRTFASTESITLRLYYHVKVPQRNFRFIVYLNDQYGTNITSIVDHDISIYKGRNIELGDYCFECTIPPNFLNEGNYQIEIDGGVFNLKSIFKSWKSFGFSVELVNEDFVIPDGKRDGSILTYFNMRHLKS